MSSEFINCSVIFQTGLSSKGLPNLQCQPKKKRENLNQKIRKLLLKTVSSFQGTSKLPILTKKKMEPTGSNPRLYKELGRKIDLWWIDEGLVRTGDEDMIFHEK